MSYVYESLIVLVWALVGLDDSFCELMKMTEWVVIVAYVSMVFIVDVYCKWEHTYKWEHLESKKLPDDFAVTVLMNHLLHGLVMAGILIEAPAKFGLDTTTTETVGFIMYLIELAMCFLAYDVIFYNVHRFVLHNNGSLHKYHVKHHSMQADFGLSGFYMHPLDMLLEIAIPLWAVLYLIKPHWLSSTVYLMLGALNSVYSHGGEHLPGMASPKSHAMHHKYPSYNFGIGLCDYYCKTMWKLE